MTPPSILCHAIEAGCSETMRTSSNSGLKCKPGSRKPTSASRFRMIASSIGNPSLPTGRPMPLQSAASFQHPIVEPLRSFGKESSPILAIGTAVRP